MTTIAYRNGVMAADSQVTKGADGVTTAIVPECPAKLHRLPDGAIIGISGTFEAALAWLDAAKAGGLAAARGIDIGVETCILSATAGEVDCLGRQALRMWMRAGSFELCQPVTTGFYAMGSGKAAALGALYAGADALAAVQIAARIDPYTGGEIMTMRVGGAAE